MRTKNKNHIVYYEEVTSLPNLLNAWQQFSRDKKQKQDVMEYGLHLMDNLYNLYTDLQSGTYTHGTYTHFTISDPKPRDIHKSPVRDRIVHHLLYNALYPYWDTKFIHDSYSCRIDKGTHKALERFKQFHNTCSQNNTKTVYVLKCDIRKFFASIDHEILLTILHKHIHDEKLYKLLENIVRSFHTPQVSSWVPTRDRGLVHGQKIVPWMPDQVRHDNNSGKPLCGLPLGNLTSQLLVNVYMNIFDQYVKHTLKQKYYIRYADDFIIMSQSKLELENLVLIISEFLTMYLKLNLHPNKVSIATIASGIDFLGWVHFPYHRVLRSSTKRRMMRNLRKSDYDEKVMSSYTGLCKWGSTYGLVKEIERQQKTCKNPVL